MSNVVNLPTSWACSPTQADAASAERRALAAQIVQDITYIIGVEPRPYHVDQIAWYLQCGFDHGMIIAAAESTAMAPRPTWAYFKAIMRNCARDGCHTAEEYEQRIETWRSLGPFEARQRWARDISLGRDISIQPRESII